MGKYREGEIQQGPKNIYRVPAFEMKMGGIYIKRADIEWGIIWGCGECSWESTKKERAT